MTPIDTLNQVVTYLKRSFVGKDELIDLLAIGLLARENAFLFGPPGTAKSAIVQRLATCIDGGRNFDYLLTRFTEPNELFGPFDIRKLKEGELVTNTDGMLPEAALVFLDEIFNANSAILNSLLLALNEKVFRRGKETRALPALMFVGASNALPDDDALAALLDRFLIRVKCDYVDPDRLDEVLVVGWQLENADPTTRPTIAADTVRQLQAKSRTVDLAPIRKAYVDLVHTLRNTGINVSDRRAVKLQSLIAASALLCGRSEAILSDLWVLKYIWDTEEQIEILAGLVDAVIEQDIAPEQGQVAHPQAIGTKQPNAEDLMAEVILLRDRWTTGLTLPEQSVLKDKLRYVQTRVNWVQHIGHKQHIQTELDGLWQQIIQTM
ncbi:AAA family ATPase [Fibrella aquatilis]|uniref:AAA family ATPase n=1 Tax=Fibrella aquatilis TaxID=2817059 RepID=A0A939G844_9BACT|nr:AAA family ATPase [Fibrella aquatilis]MBO0931806.1 AAA family ATPase [Fibrella aquatilis]